MAASATDLLMEVGTPGTATTLSANYTAGNTSITVASTANWPTTTGVTFAMDEAETVNGEEVQVAGSYREFVGTVATATSITNVDCVYGTDRDFSAGATTRVYVPVSAERENRIVEWGLTHADQDGTLKAGAVDVTAVLADDVVTRAKVNDADQIGIAGSYAPQGYMVNGKISRTVATNDITVAIKTLDDQDPSATNPVHVRIGNTVRSITSALSVTKTDGTNWMNLGATEHAAQDVDLFTYLGYNATDGVVIGFARIPYARTYADFNTTSTNERYCAISTITNATSSDEYEVVGRFNATLSAGASYNWSVPATSVVINRPIYETRWTVFNANPTGYSSQPTAVYKYKVSLDTCAVNARRSNNTTSNSTALTFTLPFDSSADGLSYFAGSNAVDNGTVITNSPSLSLPSSSKTLTAFRNHGAATWTAASTKGLDFNINYDIE